MSGQATPPRGIFTALAAGSANTCGLALDHSAVCWGDNRDGESTPPPVSFAKIALGFGHGCGIQSDGRPVCWGLNDSGQATPLVDRSPLVNVAIRGCSPCRAGEPASIILDFSNPGPRRTFELAVVSHHPDGDTVARLVPDDHEVTLENGESTLEIPIIVPNGLPVGFYFLEAALLDNISGLTLSRHSASVRLDP
jgi:Regulator of chromosome condensation (RCC1) repeat